MELEIGFGKGRFLLAEAARHPERHYLGIESAQEYYRFARDRAGRRGLGNVTVACGEALYLVATCMAPGSAQALHVYFPDPWPKARHQRRRLLNAENVDLVLGLLAPGGVLYFASDHAEYADSVRELFSTLPGTRMRERFEPWPDGARTNYEVKYEAEGRPIVRLELTKERDQPVE